MRATEARRRAAGPLSKRKPHGQRPRRSQPREEPRMPDSPVEGFIRDQWNAGERDQDLVTKRLIEAILLAADPESILWPVMATEVSGRFRTFTRALEREAGPLDRDPAQIADGSQADYGRAAQYDDDTPDSDPAQVDP